jgi:hypothetical protein
VVSGGHHPGSGIQTRLELRQFVWYTGNTEEGSIEMDESLKGRRVRLESTSDPYTDLEPGAEGTVNFQDAAGTLHVDWDSGSLLGLVRGQDHWTILT